MATSSRSGATRTERRHEPRSLGEKVLAFVGLFLVPIPALLTAWLIYAWLGGVDLHWGPIDWVAPMPTWAPEFAEALILLGSVYLGRVAHQFAEHRKESFRAPLTYSTASLGVLFAINVGTGPDYVWSGIFVIAAWFVAALWSLARLNVTRQDPREQGEHEEGPIEAKLKGFRLRRTKTVLDDKTGEPVRTEMHFDHPGETIDALQQTVPNMESAAGAPANLSRATRTDRADQSVATILHTDPLAGRLPFGPPSHPGGSIEDPLSFATYDDGHPVWCYLGGGPGFSPSAYGFMGMTRTGKTVAENLMFTELITRRDVVILYLNRAKGLQDVRPIIPGVEVAVLTDNIGDFVSALNRVKAIMSYRQRTLAAYGLSRWSARDCFHHPRQRKANGEAVPMEPMPALIVHVGEADDLLGDGGTGADLHLYVTSKGLSLGVITGDSLQRASAESMPTGLRFNIGTWWCFGTSDAVSAGFALSDATVKAGAHPENWKQSKPGNHYFEGVGIDDTLFAKRAKTQSGDSDDALTEAMLARNLEWSLRMARLDRGSAEATAVPGAPGNWWDLSARNTANIRSQLLGGTATVTANHRPAEPATVTAGAVATAAEFTAAEPADHQTAEHLAVEDEVSASIAGVREIDGFELYPTDEDGNTSEGIDLNSALPPPPPDGIDFSDTRPPALGPEDARVAFVAALRELIEIDELRDPADPSGNTVVLSAGEINSRYRYRSRPWFSDTLKRMANGEITPPPALALSRAEDLGSGKYRLSRVPDDHAE